MSSRTANGLVVTICRSKTDQEGAGETLAFAGSTGDVTGAGFAGVGPGLERSRGRGLQAGASRSADEEGALLRHVPLASMPSNR